MLSELLQDRAAFYLAGSMSPPERDLFELVLANHDELRRFVAEAQQAPAALVFAEVEEWIDPPTELKARLLDTVRRTPRPLVEEALVVADGLGRIDWVNAAFTAMCGFTLDELRGKKPGQVLQGPQTDPAAVGRLRAAVREARPCREVLVNYHKDGSAYIVDLKLSPVRDEAGGAVWFVAQERKVAEGAVVAG